VKRLTFASILANVGSTLRKADTGWRTMPNDAKVHFDHAGTVDKGPAGMVGKKKGEFRKFSDAFPEKGAPAKQHPADNATGAEIAEHLHSKVGAQHADTYMDLASVADKEMFAGWMHSAAGLSPKHAETLRQHVREGEQKRKYEAAVARRDRDLERSFKSQGHAAADRLDSDKFTHLADKSPVPAEAGTGKVGAMLGALAQHFPVVQQLIDARVVRGIRKLPEGARGTGHAASFENGYIDIGNLSIAESPRTILHEVGHGLEHFMPDGWITAPHWNDNTAKTASQYGAHNAAEALAEGFTELIGGDSKAFEKWAPEQVADIRYAIDKATRRDKP
jgi:hypothetical protein